MVPVCPHRAVRLPVLLGALNLEPVNPEHAAALRPILTRRSTAALFPPGPSADQVDALLRAATTVPDHSALRPWRFVVVSGDARQAFGDALAAAALEERPELADAALDRIRSKAFVAPALIAVAAHVDPSAKVPVWEQVASATCAGYAIALAAHQLGLGAIWKSAPVHRGVAIEKALDLTPDDEFLGWVNLGHTGADREIIERPMLDLGAYARTLDVDGTPLRYGD
jgi:nitroreductase